MSRAPRLSECVAWSSSPVPRWRRAVRWVPTVVGGFLELLLGSVTGPLGGPERTDPPFDADVPLGVVTVTGAGAGMPDPRWGPQTGTVHVDRVSVAHGLSETDLPLRSLALGVAVPVPRRFRARKAVDAVWTLEVAGAGAALTIEGPWLLLAHLGTLADWPEPE